MIHQGEAHSPCQVQCLEKTKEGQVLGSLFEGYLIHISEECNLKKDRSLRNPIQRREKHKNYKRSTL